MSIALLLIEENLTRAALIRDWLVAQSQLPSVLTVARHLHQAKEVLKTQDFDLVLLTFGSPDRAGGLASLDELQKFGDLPPIIVLSAFDDSRLALDALRQGAQDFLVYGHFEGKLLVRAINFALERHRVQQQWQVQIDRERLLGRMIERIRQSLDLDVILQTTVEEVLQFLGADRVLIYRCKSYETGAIVAEAQSDRYSPEDNVELSSALLQELSIQAAVTAFPHGQSPEVAWDKLLKTLVNSVLTVPIWQNKTPHVTNLWGQLIACNHCDRRDWHDWEILFLSRLANQVAIAIRQSMLYEQSQRQAFLDGLTGIANRRAFNRKLIQEWRRSRREQTPLTLVLCDIDYFKRYNDVYGHPQGDRCLQQVAKILQRTIRRPADLVARYGGEEFVLILPKTELQGAVILAAQVRQSLADHALSHCDSLVGGGLVTLSMGVATQIPHQGTNPYALLKQADLALLSAKQTGRDRIITF